MATKIQDGRHYSQKKLLYRLCLSLDYPETWHNSAYLLQASDICDSYTDKKYNMATEIQNNYYKVTFY